MSGNSQVNHRYVHSVNPAMTYPRTARPYFLGAGGARLAMTQPGMQVTHPLSLRGHHIENSTESA